MRLRELTILRGPVALRDLVAGTGGVVVGGVAFITGCAYAGVPTLVWFATVSLVGAVALGSALPVVRQVRQCVLMDAEGERRDRKAAA
jgi:hypothetical protein